MDHIPLSLYIHIPWCERKCPYCDFNSHPIRQAVPEHAYLQALLADLAWEWAALQPQRPIHSIFIGGGTPSVFRANTLTQLIFTITQQIECIPNLEITLEANPGTVDYSKLVALKEGGINRLSLGIQSFQDAHLQRLGRIHDRHQALMAITHAQRAGFSNLNLDLMYGLPQQTLVQAIADIQQAIACQPSHISFYQLTIEPQTAFYRHPPPLPDDELIWESQQACQALLAQAGYQHYEVSAYAQAGQCCQHNFNYWEFGDYIGIGAGAHSKLTYPNGEIVRHSKHKHPDLFMRQAGQNRVLASQEPIAPAQRPLEFMMNALRLKQGFHPALFTQRTGLSLAQLDALIQPALAQGLLFQDQATQRITTTMQGWHYLDNVLQLFMN